MNENSSSTDTVFQYYLKRLDVEQMRGLLDKNWIGQTQIDKSYSYLQNFSELGSISHIENFEKKWFLARQLLYPYVSAPVEDFWLNPKLSVSDFSYVEQQIIDAQQFGRPLFFAGSEMEKFYVFQSLWVDVQRLKMAEYSIFPENSVIFLERLHPSNPFFQTQEAGIKNLATTFHWASQQKATIFLFGETWNDVLRMNTAANTTNEDLGFNWNNVLRYAQKIYGKTPGCMQYLEDYAQNNRIVSHLAVQPVGSNKKRL